METDPFLVSYLAEHDTACPSCRYNLRGLRGSACPECGAAVALRVALAEPKLGVFLSVLIALSAGLGFNLFLLGWGLWGSVARGFPDLRQLWSVALFSVICGAFVVLVLRHRRWLRERDRAVQAGIIAASGVVSVGSVFVFFAIVQ